MSKRKPKSESGTRLLVSVMNAAEASEAVENGADLIDVKDPRHGSLGASNPFIWNQVRKAVDGRVPLSAAHGELRENNVEELARYSDHLSFAKVGLKGCTNPPTYDWPVKWHDWRSQLTGRAKPVMVVYADWRDCGAPSPQEILNCVKGFRVPYVLVDTCDKNNGTIREHCSNEQLVRFIAAVHKLKAKVVLAGSLQLSDLTELLPMAPDYVAVRGAVCRGSRAGRLDGALVREWAQALSASRK